MIVDDPLLGHIRGGPARMLRVTRIDGEPTDMAVASIAPVPVYEGNELKRFDLSIELCPAPRRIDYPTWPAVLPQWQINQLQAENSDVDLSRWFKPMPEPGVELIERRVERRIAEQMGMDPPHLP